MSVPVVPAWNCGTERASDRENSSDGENLGYESADVLAYAEKDQLAMMSQYWESDDELQMKPKPERMPISSGAKLQSRSSSITPKNSNPVPYHKTILSDSLSRCTPKSIPRSHAPKLLNMGTSSCHSESEHLWSVSGDLTNMLGRVIERHVKHESKLESIECTLSSPSSSVSSGSECKRVVPTVIRPCLQ